MRTSKGWSYRCIRRLEEENSARTSPHDQVVMAKYSSVAGRGSVQVEGARCRSLAFLRTARHRELKSSGFTYVIKRALGGVRA